MEDVRYCIKNKQDTHGILRPAKSLHKLKQHKSRNSVFAYICGRNPRAKREIGILEELFSDLPLSRVDLGSRRKMWIINKKSSCHKDGSKNGKGKKIVGWTAEKLFVILKDGDVFLLSLSLCRRKDKEICAPFKML